MRSCVNEGVSMRTCRGRVSMRSCVNEGVCQ